MPIYEYRCTQCRHEFELQQKFSDDPISVCPECKGVVQKIISSPGILFKGGGFYANDKGSRSTFAAKDKKEAAPVEKPSTAEVAPAKEKKETPVKENKKD